MPSLQDFEVLIETAGGTEVAGEALKATNEGRNGMVPTSWL